MERFCFELTQKDETFTSRIFLRFVRKLRKEFPSRKIVLIVDGDPIHIAKIVQGFQRKHEAFFRLEIFPSYSPELNPTEKTWGFVKTKKLSASTATDKQELRQKTHDIMKNLKKDKNKISSFFDEQLNYPMLPAIYLFVVAPCVRPKSVFPPPPIFIRSSVISQLF